MEKGRDLGDERAGRSCSYGGGDTTEAVDLAGDGDIEGEERDKNIQEFFWAEEEAVLGESLLGTGVLCEHGRNG